LKALSVR